MKVVIEMNIEDVKEQTIGPIYNGANASIVELFVRDEEYHDTYRIIMQRQHICGQAGIGGLCFLNGTASYQADFNFGGYMKLKEVINNIAGGDIFNK